MKSFIGFCDPITLTQECIQTKLEKTQKELEGKFIISVEHYKRFECPKFVIFKQSDNSIDWLRYAEIEKKFFQDFLGQGEELDSMRQKQYKNLSLSEESAFQKYSRALNEQEIASLPEGLKADKVRIVDFESIIAGFDNDDLKKFVESLQSDQEQLKEELLNWITNKKIYAKFDCIAYTPNDVIQEECKASMRNAIEKLLNYRAGREMLILVLCIEKFKNEVLKIFISNCGPYIEPNNEVYLNFSQNLNCEAQSLYHEFNHWIHQVLGLEATLKIAGDFSTKFEKAFLKLRDYEAYTDILKEIGDDEIYQAEPCKTKRKHLKVFDVEITWDCLEELWNIVGFANVKFIDVSRGVRIYLKDIIYVNRLSDMDLLKISVWGHETQFCKVFSQNKKLKEMYEEGPKEPDSNAWRAWCELHNLSKDKECRYIKCPQAVDLIQKELNFPKALSRIKKEVLWNDLLSDPCTYEWKKSDEYETWFAVNGNQINNLLEKAETLLNEEYLSFTNVIFGEGEK